MFKRGAMNGDSRGRLTGVIVALTLVTVAGCGARGEPAASPTISQIRPRTTAVLTILGPTPGAVVSGTKLRVRLSLAGARIISETTTRLAPDEGHIHLLIDGKVVSMTYGLDQEVEVTKGTHLLQAEFVANDHFPFNPRVITVAPFIVQ